MDKRVSLVSRASVFFLALANLVACGHDAIDSVPPLNDYLVLQAKQKELAKQTSFVDDEGYRWIKRHDIVTADREVALPYFSEQSLPHAKPLQEMSLQEATEDLRPAQEFGNAEFVMDDESSQRFAAMLQDVARVNAERDARGESGADGEPPLPEMRLDGNLSPTNVGGDGRTNWSTFSDDWPYTTIGWMTGNASGVCTCFKMSNHHTCVTAAHCLYQGNHAAGTGAYLPRGNIWFRHPSASQIKVTPSECWTRIIFNLYSGGADVKHDFGVIRFRGHGAYCEFGTYNTGYLGWQNIADNTQLFLWHAGYPGGAAPLLRHPLI